MSIKTINTYSWEGPGGINGLRFIVVQAGKTLQIIDGSIEPLSDGRIYQETLALDDDEINLSFATVDGKLVVATGQGDILSYSYQDGVVVKRSGRLRVRDMFGVEDVFDGVDLTEGLGLSIRPTSLTPEHHYNLRNQTFGPKRAYRQNGVREFDPVNTLNVNIGSPSGIQFPSNSDNIHYAIAKDPTSNFPLVDFVYPPQMRSNPVGTSPAPRGYFVIDALTRGQSRLEEFSKLERNDFGSIILPADITPGGASCVSSYSGRVFYAGFNSGVVEGDSKSPRMSGYVLFSKLVQNDDDVYRCYQEGDPTSSDVPDLLDTDGGFVKVSGANNICFLANLSSALMIFAENGVWMLSGGSDYGFSANNYMVTKISDRGTRFQNSVVVVDNTAFYWSDSGIFVLRQNELGDWGSQSLSEASIQTLYSGIGDQERFYAKGVYDSFQGRVRWLYNNTVDNYKPSMELVFDTLLGAFYLNEIGSVNSPYPKVCSAVVIPQFGVRSGLEEVVHEGAPVVDGISEVVLRTLTKSSSPTSEVLYVTVYHEDEGDYFYGFTSYSNEKFLDWEEVNGQGIDAQAVLVTGYVSGGDNERNKQVPYLVMHFERTEEGVDEIGGEFIPRKQSSCIVQAQWSWNNTAAGGKWGVPFQAYRYKRPYQASGIGDLYDNGESVLSTRNKLRGIGKVLSLKISSEPRKDLKLIGWSMVMDANGDL